MARRLSFMGFQLLGLAENICSKLKVLRSAATPIENTFHRLVSFQTKKCLNHSFEKYSYGMTLKHKESITNVLPHIDFTANINTDLCKADLSMSRFISPVLQRNVNFDLTGYCKTYFQGTKHNFHTGVVCNKDKNDFLSVNSVARQPAGNGRINKFRGPPSQVEAGGRHHSKYPVNIGIPRLLSTLIVKQSGSGRKKVPVINRHLDKTGLKLVTAYATAEEYEIDVLKTALEAQGLYVLSSLPTDLKGAIHAKAKYTVDEEPRELFFFREGCVVLWNMPAVERNEVLKFLKKYSIGQYDADVLEQEQLKVVSTLGVTNVVGDTVYLQEKKEEEGTLEKYAFSNGLSLSVKLGIWEASLEKFINSIEPVTEDLKSGEHVRITRHEALQKIGEIFALRHLINLSSDLLDTPDFYWEHENLERLYQKTSSQLTISRRTKVMNEKLNYCIELMELLNSHMNDAHHVRLEWMIILLIMVEVAFEVLHHIEKYLLLHKLTHPQTKNISASVSES